MIYCKKNTLKQIRFFHIFKQYLFDKNSQQMEKKINVPKNISMKIFHQDHRT